MKIISLRLKNLNSLKGEWKIDFAAEPFAGSGLFAITGPTGAGKTTLFSLVTRLYSNVTGSIEVAGHDVRRQPAQAMARLGVVFQSRALDADLSVAQNLAYHAALHGIRRRDALPRIAEVAATGVDYISVGALTHSVPVLDLGLDF